MRSEQRVYNFDVGAPPARSAWDPADPSNFAVISRGGNDAYLMRNDDSGRGGFRKGYTRCLGRKEGEGRWGRGEGKYFTAPFSIVDYISVSRDSIVVPSGVNSYLRSPVSAVEQLRHEWTFRGTPRTGIKR